MDDQKSRYNRFLESLRELDLSDLQVNYAKNYDECIKFLEGDTQWDCVFLDHDLSEETQNTLPPEGENLDGRAIVNWILNNQVSPTVYVVHSFNLPAGLEMFARLKDQGLIVFHVPGIWTSPTAIRDVLKRV